MRPLHQLITAGAAALILAGCPNVIPTAPTIDRVELTLGEGASSFTLDIHGRGFALKGVSYSLDDGQGSTRASDVVARISHSVSGRIYRSLPSNTKILSPQQATARFLLEGESLATGVYALRLYFQEPGAEPEDIAVKEGAFEVRDDVPAPDAGPRDLGVLRPDASADAGEPSDGPPRDADPAGDAEPTEAGSLDADPTDADDASTGDASPPDSGLGDFIGDFGYRRSVLLTNPYTSPTPLDLTVRIPVPHADWVAAGRSKPDASDLAVYNGGTRLEHDFDDRMAVGTNDLALIVAIPFSVQTTHTLSLYFGDPNLSVPRSDAVYLLIERFDAPLPNTWNNAGAWTRNCFGRNVSTPSDIALCGQDSTANPTRRTIASPRVNTLRDNASTAVYASYELSVWVAGRMDEANDLVYFAYSNTTDNFAGAILLPDGFYRAYPPNASTTFQEVNNLGARTVNGWRLPAGSNQPFTRAVARFIPNIDQPSLHFRYISPNGSAAAGTLVGLDDLSVRRVLEPDFGLSFGDIEARP